MQGQRGVAPVVLDAVAAAEKDHDLLVQILLQESEQQQQPLVRRHHHVALLQTFSGGRSTAVIHSHI
jgi:hypothetical protein